MNTASGLDNRLLLPPFIPAGRNMDGVFAMTMRCCFPKQYVGLVPYVVPHDPPARNWRSLVGYGLRLSDILVMALELVQVPRHSTDSAANMRTVGHHLMHIGTLSIKVFDDWLRLNCYRSLIARLRRTADAWREAELSGPSPWREHCHESLEVMADVVDKMEDFSARDLRTEGTTPQHSLRATQLAIRRFGELLVW